MKYPSKNFIQGVAVAFIASAITDYINHHRVEATMVTAGNLTDISADYYQDFQLEYDNEPVQLIEYLLHAEDGHELLSVYDDYITAVQDDDVITGIAMSMKLLTMIVSDADLLTDISNDAVYYDSYYNVDDVSNIVNKYSDSYSGDNNTLILNTYINAVRNVAASDLTTSSGLLD